MRIFLITALLVFHLPAEAITFKPPAEPSPKDSASGASRWVDSPSFEPPPDNPRPHCKNLGCRRGGAASRGA
ncbi:MAG: hypothetical protein KME29_04920 [Calothrix sp. FI2-JRJ7]|jgi:hypothetical protein|nr:hypothetical protein [Calothrix sp. FI2-JRJ7]